MITELIKVEPEVVGGRKIAVVEYNIRNYRIHQVLEQLSRLLLFCLECDSNNTNSKNLPSDTRGILTQWDIVKTELDFSLKFNDRPQASYETAYKVLLVDQKEIQKIRNVKVKRAVAEIYRCAFVMLTKDSAGTQGYIAADDAAAYKECIEVVDAVLARWLGTGKEGDLGLTAPAYEILGEVQPDVDLDWSESLEGSASMPRPTLPDAPDSDVPGGVKAAK